MRVTPSLTTGKLDRSLDALERGEWFNAGQPCDLYALYVNRGLVSRAKELRYAAGKRTPHYDLDSFFDRIDKNPAEHAYAY